MRAAWHIALLLILVAAFGLGTGAASAQTTAEVRLTVRIAVPPPENHPPVAKTTGPYATGLGQPVNLSAEPSYDPDPGDAIAAYAWDLNNDGTWDSAQKNVQLVLNQEGARTVKLRVTDMAGLTSTTTTTIAVVDLYAVDYKYTSRAMLNRFIVEYGVAVLMKNTSPDGVRNVKITLTAAPAAFSLVKGIVEIGDVAAGQDLWSQDNALILRQDRRVPVQAGEQMMWTVEFDDLDGAHHIVTEVTQTR